MRKNKHNDQALASLQQLCSLGLTSEIAIQAMLDTAPGWMNADEGSFFWVDGRLKVTNYYGNPCHVDAANAFAGRCESSDIPDLPSFSGFLRNHTSMAHGGPEDPGYFQSALYNEVIRPTGSGKCLLCVVIRDELGQVRGSIAFGRDKVNRPFTDADRRTGEMLGTHLSLLFSPSAGQEEEHSELCHDRGMAVLDRNGTPVYCDDNARNLLYLAGHPDFGSLARGEESNTGIVSQIRSLCSRVESIFAGRPAAAPSLTLRTPAGRLLFRARKLGTQAQSESSLVGLDIYHYLPRRVVTWRRIQGLELPPRLQQVCLEFIEGTSMTDIAERLDISRHTVIDHVNRIYDRLGLEPSRETLRDYVLGEQIS